MVAVQLLEFISLQCNCCDCSSVLSGMSLERTMGELSVENILKSEILFNA